MRALVVIKTFKDVKKTCDLFSCKRYNRVRRASEAPQTLPDAPWECLLGSLLPGRTVGRPYIAKVVVKFVVFTFFFSK